MTRVIENPIIQAANGQNSKISSNILFLDSIIPCAPFNGGN